MANTKSTCVLSEDLSLDPSSRSADSHLPGSPFQDISHLPASESTCSNKNVYKTVCTQIPSLKWWTQEKLCLKPSCYVQHVSKIRKNSDEHKIIFTYHNQYMGNLLPSVSTFYDKTAIAHVSLNVSICFALDSSNADINSSHFFQLLPQMCRLCSVSSLPNLLLYSMSSAQTLCFEICNCKVFYPFIGLVL